MLPVDQEFELKFKSRYSYLFEMIVIMRPPAYEFKIPFDINFNEIPELMKLFKSILENGNYNFRTRSEKGISVFNGKTQFLSHQTINTFNVNNNIIKEYLRYLAKSLSYTEIKDDGDVINQIELNIRKLAN